MVKKKKRISNECVIDIDGDLSNPDKPKMRMRIRGKCPKINKDMVDFD